MNDILVVIGVIVAIVIVLAFFPKGRWLIAAAIGLVAVLWMTRGRNRRAKEDSNIRLDAAAEHSEALRAELPLAKKNVAKKIAQLEKEEVKRSFHDAFRQ